MSAIALAPHAEKALRLARMGPKIDEFEVSMNCAAEQAATAARGIFKDALTQMSFGDARRILSGGSTSATDYFKTKTSEKLGSFDPRWNRRWPTPAW